MKIISSGNNLKPVNRLHKKIKKSMWLGNYLKPVNILH